MAIVSSSYRLNPFLLSAFEPSTITSRQPPLLYAWSLGLSYVGNPSAKNCTPADMLTWFDHGSALASIPLAARPEACGPDHSSTQTRDLRCPRYLDCTFPTSICAYSAVPLTRPTRTTLTGVDGCTTYLSTECPVQPARRVMRRR
jgi:hypothetical protein